MDGYDDGGALLVLFLVPAVLLVVAGLVTGSFVWWLFLILYGVGVTGMMSGDVG